MPYSKLQYAEDTNVLQIFSASSHHVIYTQHMIRASFNLDLHSTSSQAYLE